MESSWSAKEKRAGSQTEDRNRSCKEDVFVKPSGPARVSLRRAQTPACSSASNKRRHCDTGEPRNKSSRQDRCTLKENCSPPGSCVSTCRVDLNDSIASEFDFKLLAKAKSAGGLKKVAGQSSASSSWSVRRSERPLTSTPVYGTCHERLAYGGILHDK